MQEQRNKEILILVSNGHTAVEIGAKIGLSPRTIERHIELMKAAYRARNMPHLIGIALRTGIIK